MNIVDLAQYVAPYAPGCPDPLIVQALRQVIREFCEYTKDYRETIVLPMVAGQGDYDLGAALTTDGANFLRIERVVRQSDGVPLLPFKVADFDLDSPGWEAETGPVVYAYTMTDGAGVMRVYPIPDDDIDETLGVTVSMQAARTATTLLDRFGDRHAEYLGYGAAGILLKQPNKPWSNPDAGVHYTGLFDARKSQVRGQVMRDHTTAGASVRVGSLEDY